MRDSIHNTMVTRIKFFLLKQSLGVDCRCQAATSQTLSRTVTAPIAE